MLNKRVKIILKSVVLFSSILAILLIILIYFKINSELSPLSGSAISRDQMNVHIQKASSMILIEAIMLSIIFLSVMLSLNYLLDWYFIENKNALIDDLTEVYNRKGINFFFRKEIERAERLKHPLSVAMVDIDHFKVYNDSSGHLRGDWLLKAIAKILKMNFRELDIVGRYGGEEFLVILPETGQDHAVIATERIRGLIERTKFPRMELQPEKKVTVSIGLATFNKSFDETNMVHKADSLLYMAKQKGRNRVVYNEYD